MYTQNVDSFSHLVDRLCVENIKLADFVRRLEIEQKKDEPDLALVSGLYKGVRLANESRASVKNHLDRMLSEAINSGRYDVLSEQRTFRLPGDDREEIVTRENPEAEFQPENTDD